MVEETRDLTVADDDAGERLDSWLAPRLELSRSRVVQLIEEGRVLLNDTPARKKELTVPGDRVRVTLPPPVPSTVLAENIPLNILFQDEHLLVLDKPAGLVVHPAPGNRTGTLVNALLHAVGDLSGIGGVLRPGIVHRLDRDTSGLLVVAKHDDAHRVLSDALKRREIKRAYLAAAWGHLAQEKLTVDAPIGRHPTERRRMGVVEQGRRAVTHFRQIEKWPGADLVRAELETGRTHQIRVHLLHIGHPVVGDRTYGAGREAMVAAQQRPWARALARRTPRQFLHATELRFKHPVTGAEMHFESPLPADLAAAADWARTSLQGQGGTEQ